MSAAYTHSAAYRIVDVDVDGLVAFVRQGNHCACDAVRHGGVIVYQSAGFDGPHQCRAYEVVRESDGAVIDLIEEHRPSAWCEVVGAEQTLTAWRSAAATTDHEIAATLLANLSAEPLTSRRLRFDPHPAGDCHACR